MKSLHKTIYPRKPEKILVRLARRVPKNEDTDLYYKTLLLLLTKRKKTTAKQAANCTQTKPSASLTTKVMSLEDQGPPAPATKKLKTSNGNLEELRQKVKTFATIELSERALAGMDEETLSAIIRLAETNETNERRAETNERRARLAEEEMERVSMRRLVKNTPEMALDSVFTEKSHTGQSKHLGATSKEHELDLESVDKLDLESVDKKRSILDAASCLLVKFDKDPRNKESTNKLVGSYSSESDVSSWIAASLEDAQHLAHAATGRTFHVHHEFSLWSDRPDHLVLYDQAREDPIIAVEDKKPFGEGNEMTKHVRGQMFDYLMELRCLGHSAPFAVLSTFENSWLFWQDDEESNNIAASKDRIAKINDMLGTADVSPTKVVEAEKNTPSPPVLKSEVERGGNSSGRSTFDECSRNNLLQTEVYNSKQLVLLLYTAIICGLARNPSAPRKEYSIRNSYDGIALQLKKDEYKWGHLRLSVGSPIVFQNLGSSRRRTRPPPCPKGNFFAIEKLGRGDTSKVFGAYDHDGKRCAIKMYIRRDKDNNGKLQSLKDSKETGTASCKTEAKRLVDFYPFLRGKVYFQELNTFPCVIMPFFRPLSTEEQSDEKLKDQVRGCLSALAKKGLKYRESDLRWRHMGYFIEEGGTRKELVMFDLAELEKMEESEKSTNFVESQIKNLFERLQDSKPESSN